MGLQVVVRAPEKDDKLTIVLKLNGQQRNLSRQEHGLHQPMCAAPSAAKCI